MLRLSLSSIALAIIAMTNSVSGLAIKQERSFPEVIPGPGLPSLESLGLTSADLYTMHLKSVTDSSLASLAIAQPTCDIPGNASAAVNDVIACFNFLVAIGGNNCVVPGNFCEAGTAIITGSSSVNGASTLCENIALGVQAIFTDCNTDGEVNGNVIVTGGTADILVTAMHVL